MRISIAGASGFLGTHLTDHLRDHGHEVMRLVRRSPTSAEESQWDPAAGTVDAELISWSDVVINLAGSPLIGNVHSDAWARELMESRVSTTRTLATAIAEQARPPAFLAGNGISFYGDHGTAVVTEDSASRGDALLTRVTRAWQEAADPAVAAGARVCVLRTAPVMDRSAPPLKWLRLLFTAGLGGRLGSGGQHMPMVSRRDWLSAVRFLAEHADASGPFNLCSAQTPTNAEFTQVLARHVRRPAIAAVPAPVLKVAAGKMSPELLGSVNVKPLALETAGFVHQDPDVEAVVATGLR